MFTNPSSYPELFSLANSQVIVSTVDTGRLVNFFTKQKNKIIVYSQLGDYLSENYIKEIASSENFIVVLSSHAIDVVNQPNVEIIFLESAYAEYAKLIPHQAVNFELIQSSAKTKHFLSLNNRASWYRQVLFYFFENFKIIDKSYFSYLGDLNRTGYKSYEEIDKIFASEDTWYLTGLDIPSTRAQIPRASGLETPQDIDWGVGDSRYYQECFCSIVTETYAAELHPFFTEKTFKPILFFQPFLIHGNAGCLTKLQSMGFKTFGNWWDESYDQLPGGVKRFEAMLKVILEINSWSLEKINKVYKDMLPILEHNHNQFTRVLPAMYNTEIQQVKERILEIIETHK
jgi:hypothetical protein